MVGRLLVRIGQLDQGSFVVRPSHKGDTGGQVVACKSGWDGDRRNEHEKGVQIRGALCVDVRRVYAVFDERGLVLDRFVNDGVQPIIRHDFQNIEHELASGHQVLIVFRFIGGSLQAFLSISHDFGKVRRAQHFRTGLERGFGSPPEKHLERIVRFGGADRSPGEQLLEPRNYDGIN